MSATGSTQPSRSGAIAFDPGLVPRRQPRTASEIAAYNQAIDDLLKIVARTAAAIAATSTRRHVESFAIVALEELADAGRAMLKPGSETAR